MENNRNSGGGSPAVVDRKQITRNQLDGGFARESSQNIVEPVQTAGRPYEATQISKTITEKRFNDFCANKTVGAGDQKAVATASNITLVQDVANLR